jgi:sugar phosphate isomerase/epimerase
MASEHEHYSTTRRRALQMGAGAALLAALGPLPGALAKPSPTPGREGDRANGRLVPADKLGTILFTQRDAISRRGVWSNPEPTMGRLGGPGFPEDPTDLGPLVPLPGGFLEVFEFLAAAGFRQIEFAGYNQNAANQGGRNPGPGSPAAYLDYARTLRGFLDAAGLEAVGNHGFIPNTWPGPGSPGGVMTSTDHDRFQVELEFAAILGMSYMGTGTDPTSSSQQEAWDLAAEKWEALNALSMAGGIRIYPHNHADAYDVLQDGPLVEVTEDLLTGEPLPAAQMVRGSSGVRRMEYFLQGTDRSTHIELDVYWVQVARHRFGWFYDWDGVRQESSFDVNGFVAANATRIPLYHAKDGLRTDQAPGVGNGYSITPFGEGDIDYRRFYLEQRARGFPSSVYEQDNAPGGGSDPGRSLRDSRVSQLNLAGLRG